VQVVNTGVAGLKAARRKIPDLVLLDVMMPGMDGYTVCKEMREDALLKDVPIIFLTAKNKVEDKIVGLSVGADDYLGKPFNVDELLLRVKAILRRTHISAPSVPQPEKGAVGHADVKTRPINTAEVDPVLRIGDYSLDTRSYMFSSPKKGKVRLTPIQYTLLYHLMTHPNKIFSPSLLLDEVCGITHPIQAAPTWCGSISRIFVKPLKTIRRIPNLSRPFKVMATLFRPANNDLRAPYKDKFMILSNLPSEN